jgi:hypothetical protein
MVPIRVRECTERPRSRRQSCTKRSPGCTHKKVLHSEHGASGPSMIRATSGSVRSVNEWGGICVAMHDEITIS